MKHTWTITFGVFVAAILLTALMSSQAQDATPFPPEATVMPDGAIFIAPGRCLVSPDESRIAVRDYGVFDLPDGQKAFDLTGDAILYSPDNRYFVVSGVGLHDSQTGQLLIESPSRYPSFSPDSRFYIAYDIVYALPSLEQVTDLDREGDGVNSYSWGRFINNDLWYTYEKTFTTADQTMLTFVNATTWLPVLDTSIYLPMTPISFSQDFRRYAVGGVGVFELYSGEKLFDLSEGLAHFSTDSATILMTPRLYPPPSDIALAFLDGETGATLNQFSVPGLVYSDIMSYGAFFTSPDMSKIAMPDVLNIGVDGQENYVLQGWRLIDVRTNTLIKQWRDNSVVSAYQELGRPVPTSHRIIDGRYVIEGQGVFDAATDALVMPLIGQAPYLTEGGTYAVTQNPCTVWRLP